MTFIVLRCPLLLINFFFYQYTDHKSTPMLHMQPLKLEKGALNCVHRSPSIMGILVADRKFFGEIGSLDDGMKIYGGENVELGIRVRRFNSHITGQYCANCKPIELSEDNFSSCWASAHGRCGCVGEASKSYLAPRSATLSDT